MPGSDAVQRDALPLFERDAALEAMAAFLQNAEAGRGGTLLVLGTPGIGKTAVMRSTISSGYGQGFQVASAVGSPMEADLPYGLIGQALLALGAEIERFADPEGGRPTVLYRVLRWLAEIAERQPALIVLDDLHWADADTLHLVGFLARRIRSIPLALVGSLRPEPNAALELAEELAGSGHAGVVALESLSKAGSANLLERALGEAIDESLSNRLWRACRGTPLLLELAASRVRLGEDLPGDDIGSRASDDSGDQAAGGAMTPLVLARFVGLGPKALAYLRAASTFGTRFSPKLAGALAGIGAATWPELHERLVRTQLIQDLGENLATFAHPLFAEALATGLSAPERARAHSEAFRLLAATGSPDALAAEHAVAAGLRGDPLAIEVTARAGRAALAEGALESACTHLGNAVELTSDNTDGSLILDWASALAARGRVEEAQAACRRALEGTSLSPPLQVQAQMILARCCFVGGEPGQGDRMVAQAATLARADPVIETRVLLEGILVGHNFLPADRLVAMTSRALAIAPAQTAKPIRLIHEFTKLTAGDASGVAMLRTDVEALSRNASCAVGAWVWPVAVHVLNTYKLLEDFERAAEQFARSFARAQAEGAPVAMVLLLGSHADTLRRMGRLHESLALCERATQLPVEEMSGWADLFLAAQFTEMGRDEEARPHLDAVRAFRVGVPDEYWAPLSMWLDILDARRLLEAGDATEASSTMAHAAHVASVTGYRHPAMAPWHSLAVEAHMIAGEQYRARDTLEDLKQLADSLPGRWAHAHVFLGNARIHAAEEHVGAADRCFDEALEAFARLHMPIDHAEALLARGAHLRRTRRPREARAFLRRALELAEAAGAGRVARLVRPELAAAGGRRRRRRDDPTRLTPQEERIAALAADGLTNAQIAAALHLSPRTVGHHLSHIYSKLEIESRTELIRRRAEGTR